MVPFMYCIVCVVYFFNLKQKPFNAVYLETRTHGTVRVALIFIIPMQLSIFVFIYLNYIIKKKPNISLMFLFYFIYLFYEEILTFTESRTSEIKSGRNRILPERFILLRRRRCFVRNLRTLIRFVLKSLLLKTNHRLVTNSIDLRSICGACVQF